MLQPRTIEKQHLQFMHPVTKQAIQAISMVFLQRKALHEEQQKGEQRMKPAIWKQIVIW